MDEKTILGLALTLGYVASIISLEKYQTEHFTQDVNYPTYPQSKVLYADSVKNEQFAKNPQMFAGPQGGVPQYESNVNLNNSGDQLLGYQLYQQAVNAATPTKAQLDSISGESQQQTGNDSPLRGGVSSDYAPYDILGSSEYQAVNTGNHRAQAISACAQNAPTFVATSLLPKPSVPGQESWDVNSPDDILASQNFLAATQQMGVDTVLSSLRNSSRDIRGDIPNPINVVSPWLQSTIDPDLTRRPLQCFVPQSGLYGCGSSGYNA